MGLGRTGTGNKAAIGDISREFYQAIGHHYGSKEGDGTQWSFETHVVLASYPSISWLRDVHLTSSSSPAINEGLVIPGITNSINGAAPDMGAFEC